MRLKLEYDPEVFPIDEDHVVLRLSSERDCARVEGGPWFVGGPLMALDSWKSDFLPIHKSIYKTVVWMRLPELPLEYWVPSAIMIVAGEAGDRLSINNFTDLMRKIGYARIRVELDTFKPLQPGILIQGKRTVF